MDGITGLGGSTTPGSLKTDAKDSSSIKTSTGGGDLAGGIIGGLAEIGNLIGDMYYSQKQLEVAEDNYDLQKKMFKYSKDLQREVFEREDNAALRRVLDLKRAGLSPTLAAGSAASSGPIVSTVAPQKQLPGSIPHANAMMAMNMMSMKQQIDKTAAENDYIRQQTNNAKANERYTNVMSGIKAHDLKNMTNSGMSSNSSEFGKWWQDLVGASDAGYMHGPIRDIADKIILNTTGKHPMSKGGASGKW